MHYYMQTGEQIRRLDELEFEIIKQTQPLRLVKETMLLKLYESKDFNILETVLDLYSVLKIR